MKKLLSLFLLVFISIQFTQGQVPQGFNYQAVLRDASGSILANENVTVIISILQGTIDGTEVFTETHTGLTNEHGLINLQIGSINVSGFSEIDWTGGPYFLNINVNGTDLGTSQLLSVPFALHAKTAEDFTGTITESDPVYVVSIASGITQADTTNWNTAHDWGNHSSENYLKTEIDGSVTNEIQDLTNVLNQGADANGSNISNLADPLNDQDAATKKYIQNILVSLDLVPNNFEGFVTDYDGNIYKTVKIGTQIWMSKNLTVTHYANGDEIPLVTDNNDWSSLTTGAQCIYGSSPGPNEAPYGHLYNGYAILDSRNICPDGWHVPSDDEWKVLEMYLGMSQADADAINWRGTNEGGKLKETGTFHWMSPNTGATNESGFTARPGGFRYNDGSFSGIGFGGDWWSSTEDGTDSVWDRYMVYDGAYVHRDSNNKGFGFSVRCIKD